MSSRNATVSLTATAGPVLMFGYGVLRFVDGLDGDRGNGLAWDAGHILFFVAMVLFGVLAVALRPSAPAWARRVGAGAVAASLFGVGCFLWVIAGDLSERFRETAPLPDVLATGGSALFPLGMLALLGLMVAARRAPVWSPLLFGAGITAISVDLDMLPIASLVILAGLAPLARSRDDGDGRGAGRHTARRAPAIPSPAAARPGPALASPGPTGPAVRREVTREAVRARFQPRLSGH